MAPRKKKVKLVVTAPDATAEAAAGSGATAESNERAPTRRTLRGRRGSLKDMLNMPLDVLFEIFGRMHPRDLLNLARTSKDFRALLMSRDSALFWKAAREQVPGLPECPAFLSEPHSLICDNCLKKNAQMFVWEFFVRVVKETSDMCALKADIEAETGIEEPFYSTALMPRTKNSYSMVAFAHTPDYNALEKQWEALKTAEEKISFAKAQVALVKANIEVACANVVPMEDKRSTGEIRRIRSIIAHLREEGWTEELRKMDYMAHYDFRSHKAMRKPQKLTESAWVSIREEVIALMEQIREARQQRERDMLWSTRLDLMCQVVSAYDLSSGRRTAMSETQAQFADLALMPPFRALVDAPPDTSVTAQDFENLCDSIPALRAEWLEARRAEFLGLIPEKLSQGLKPELSLELAMAGCTGPFMPTIQMSSMNSLPAPWHGNTRDLLFSERWKVARSVITALGKDPDTTTYDQMMQQQARMICLCGDGDPMEVGCREAHDWKGAIVHVLTAAVEEECFSRRRAKHRWHVLDAEEAARVIALEVSEVTSELDLNPLTDHCITYVLVTSFLCHYLRSSATLTGSTHDIKDPRIDEDFYVHPDRRGKVDNMKPVYVYPAKNEDGEDTVIDPDLLLESKCIFQTTQLDVCLLPFLPLLDFASGTFEGRERKKARTSEVVDDSQSSTSLSDPSAAGPVVTTSNAAQEPANGDARRPARRAVRGRRGALKAMLEMPLDVLFEIFGRMHPRDLLNLARTSKDFRSLLMSRTTTILWRAARQQIQGLPECPPFLSEPQYANLLFFSYFHGCLKPNVESALWNFYVRYCPRCKDIMSVSMFSACLKGKADVRGRLLAHIPEVERFEAVWNALATDADRARFALEQLDLVKQKTAFAAELALWKAQEAEARSCELDSLRQERIDEVLKRLREDGFGNDIDDLDPVEYDRLVYHNAVSKAQKLTDSAWQSLRPRLVLFLTALKQERLERERVGVVCGRLRMMQTSVAKYEQAEGHRTAASELQAHFSDFAFMYPFRELVEAPSTAKVTSRHFDALSGKIPALRVEWLEARRSESVALIPLEVINAWDGVDPLSLAISTFVCRECCREDLRWPNILAHSCARQEPPVHGLYEAMVQDVCDDGNTPYFWNSDGLFKYNHRWELERRTIAECGKDPDTATFEEMEQCRARLLCLVCTTPKDPYREAFDWKGAWKLLDPEETEKVIALEVPYAASWVPLPNAIHCCAYCRYQSGIVHPISHCMYIHKVAHPKQGEDYYLFPDCPSKPLSMKPVRVYPTHTPEGEPIVIPQGERAIISSSFTYSDIGD
ncbi:hypothetical protein GY45DRAFT_1335658 [Cubamyces sp. BRFM 1775]|nr:hypothetical protein GY45DRAFT_1335658 [Cubamyces sp. BRFM 1775]